MPLLNNLSGRWKQLRNRTLPPSRTHFTRELARIRSEIQAVADLASAPILTRTFNLNPSYIQSPAEQVIFNPSVVVFNNEIVFLSRSNNWLLLRDHEYVPLSDSYHSSNFIHRYDMNSQPIATRTIDQGPVKTKGLAKFGVEDGRLFVWNGALWGIFAGVNSGKRAGRSFCQILVRFENWEIVHMEVLPSPTGAEWEKNWTPLVKDGRLFFVHSFDPLTILEYTANGLAPVVQSKGKTADFPLRGGTPMVEIGDVFVCLLHSTLRPPNRPMMYTHRFAVLDRNMRFVELSNPFFIQRPGVEFAAGLVRHGDSLILSYGVADRVAAYLTLPIRDLSNWIISLGDEFVASSPAAERALP